ncbi:MAG: Asp23/Gls24 family envelope stress response protein [Lachnospiraceae bacterium]|nr:Asp23/Gls24 family envelope stress response protein [Lachnospiraceae bacterium]
MSRSKEEVKSKIYVIKKDELGQVVIAEEVVAKIAGMAALEVDGVSAMSGNSTTDMIGKLSKTSLSRGVRVRLEDGVVNIALILVLTYDCSIPKVSKEVQEKVKAAVENMTGLKVSDVNVKVAGVGQSR